MADQGGRPRSPTVADRYERALRMRLAGMTPPQIAEALAAEAEQGKVRLPAGYNAHSAVMDVRRALERAQADLAALAGLHLAMELERLDGLTRTAETIMRQAQTAGDRWLALRAMDRVFRASEARDRFLSLSRTTRDAQDDAAEERGGGPVEEADGLDEVERKRSERRRRYAG